MRGTWYEVLSYCAKKRATQKTVNKLWVFVPGIYFPETAKFGYWLHIIQFVNPEKIGYRRDVLRSLQSGVLTI